MHFHGKIVYVLIMLLSLALYPEQRTLFFISLSSTGVSFKNFQQEGTQKAFTGRDRKNNFN